VERERALCILCRHANILRRNAKRKTIFETTTNSCRNMLLALLNFIFKRLDDNLEGINNFFHVAFYDNSHLLLHSGT
jgi:hypothetical protein